jgi:predicted nucleotidyltransferase
MRPKNIQKIDELVHEYAGTEPEILQKDFKNSLKAAFTPEEVVLQLQDIGLDGLKVTVVSDRHIVVSN